MAIRMDQDPNVAIFITFFLLGATTTLYLCWPLFLPPQAIKSTTKKGHAGRDEPGLRDVRRLLSGEPCRVTGRIPDWISGTFYRQCGGAFLPPSATIGKSDFVHGIAHIAALRIEGGRVIMSNRAVETQELDKLRKTGERCWHLPHETTASRRADASTKYVGPNPNVTVWKIGTGREIAALSEGPRGRIIALDGDNLGTLRVVDTVDDDHAFLHAAHFFEETIAENHHPGFHAVLTHQVETTKEGEDLHKFGYAVYWGDLSTPPLERVASLPLTAFRGSEAGSQPDKNRLSYMHTLAVTHNFVVLMASARRLDYAAFLRADGLPVFSNLWPVTSTPLHLHIFKRSSAGSSTLQFIGERSLERCHMVWHTANAFETQNGDLVIHVTSVIAKEPRLARFTVPAALLTEDLPSDTSLKIGDEDLSFLAHKFPCVNPHFLGSQHRFVYGCSFPYLPKSALYKFDGETQTHLVWDGGPDLITSEPVFLPRPCLPGTPTHGEDEGVVLSVVNVSSDDSSFLLVLDAKTFEEHARVQTPIVINHGIHSVFIPARREPREAPAVTRY